jgi:fatty-acyl-CoA synthase
VGEIATFRVPRYVRFVTEWPMSGTKMKKVILREMIAADLKKRGSPSPHDHHHAIEGHIH